METTKMILLFSSHKKQVEVEHSFMSQYFLIEVLVQMLYFEEEIPLRLDARRGRAEGIGFLPNSQGNTAARAASKPRARYQPTMSRSRKWGTNGMLGAVGAAVLLGTSSGMLMPCFCTRKRCTPMRPNVVRGRITTCSA